MNISNKLYSIIVIIVLGIIIIGVISINIKWTSENLQWDRPYKSSAEKLKIEGTLDTNQYAIDNSPIKIFVGNKELRDFRIIFMDYNIVINEDSFKNLNESLNRGVKLTNSHMKKTFKSYFNRIINSFN